MAVSGGGTAVSSFLVQPNRLQPLLHRQVAQADPGTISAILSEQPRFNTAILAI
jgi:hypothetical protein